MSLTLTLREERNIGMPDKAVAVTAVLSPSCTPHFIDRVSCTAFLVSCM